MIRHFLLLFLLSLSLYGLSDTLVLNRADSLMKGSSKSDYFRAYNDYKNIYLRSMIDENEVLKKRALQGIVKSGKRLHIDVLNYKNELSKMKVHILKKNPHKVRNSKKINIKAINVLESAKWKDSDLVLTFHDELPSSQVKYFTYYENKSRRYKYVFDIDKSMLNTMKIVKKNNLRRIKLAQYDSDTLRFVIENDTTLQEKYTNRRQEANLNQQTPDNLKGERRSKYIELLQERDNMENPDSPENKERLKQINEELDNIVKEAESDVGETVKLPDGLEKYFSVTQLEAIQALQEGDPRALAAGVGGIGQVASLADEKMRIGLAQDLYANREMKADKAAAINEEVINMNLGQAKQFGQEAQVAKEARNEAIISGISSLGQAAATASDAAPLFGKGKTNRQIADISSNLKSRENFGDFDESQIQSILKNKATREEIASYTEDPSSDSSLDFLKKLFPDLF